MRSMMTLVIGLGEEWFCHSNTVANQKLRVAIANILPPHP